MGFTNYLNINFFYLSKFFKYKIFLIYAFLYLISKNNYILRSTMKRISKINFSRRVSRKRISKMKCQSTSRSKSKLPPFKAYSCIGMKKMGKDGFYTPHENNNGMWVWKKIV